MIKDSPNTYSLFRILASYTKYPKILNTYTWNFLQDETIDVLKKIGFEDKNYFVKQLLASQSVGQVKKACIDLKVKIKPFIVKRVPLTQIN